MMRVLTVRQPWAAAIVHLGKDVENRSTNIAGGYRGPVAIHAGASKPGRRGERTIFPPSLEVEHDRAGLLLRSELLAWPYRLPLSEIVGIADLVGVHESLAEPAEARCSSWALDERWHLELANARPLTRPIPWKGALGLRELPADVADAVRARDPHHEPTALAVDTKEGHRA